MKLNEELFRKHYWCGSADYYCRELGILHKEITREMVEELLAKRVNFFMLLTGANLETSQELGRKLKMTGYDCDCIWCGIIKKYALWELLGSRLILPKNKKPKTLDKYNRHCAIALFEYLTGEKF